MDIKWKNSKTYGGLYGFIWVIEVVTICMTVIGATIMVCFNDMNLYNRLDGYYYYSGIITDEARYKTMQDVIGIGSIVLAIMSVALIIILAIMVGTGAKKEDGSIHLTWFDRIWSEIQIVLLICVGGLTYFPIAIAYNMIMRGSYLGIWRITNDYTDSMYYTTPVVTVFAILTLVTCVSVALVCITSMIKKIKAKRFLEKSIFGGIAIAVYRSVKSSDKTLLKVMGIVICGAFISATWIGLPIVLILSFVFLPRIVKQFDEIRKGVEEVKKGNLDYKIPVCDSQYGARGELGRLAADINEVSQASSIAIENELKSQRMKIDLISNVSHDLKTPLTSMISYVDLMKQEGLSSENAAEYLNIIDKKTQRLKVLTENLFEAAKASSGAIPVNMESIDLAALITQSLAEMDEKLGTKNLDVHIQNKCDDVHVMADGQLMWRVLENLLGNISKYALENSRVYINMSEIQRTKSDKGNILLEIKNISKDELNISADDLTERFKRGDESRNTEGSGLGLAIVKDFVRLMNGVFEITIDGDLFKVSVILEKV